MKKEFSKAVDGRKDVVAVFFSKAHFKEMDSVVKFRDKKSGSTISATRVVSCYADEISDKLAEYIKERPDARVSSRDALFVDDVPKANVTIVRDTKRVIQARAL